MSKHSGNHTSDQLNRIIELLEKISRQLNKIEGQVDELNDNKPVLEVDEIELAHTSVPSPEPAPH